MNSGEAEIVGGIGIGARGRDAKFTERSRSGSQRSLAVQKTYAVCCICFTLSTVGSIRRIIRSHWKELLEEWGALERFL